MIRKFLASIRGAASDRKGVTAAEYAILAVGVVIIVGSAVALFAPQLVQAFSNVGAEIATQQAAVSAQAAAR
jgi:Flp pilus assembly pilin Flp